MVDRAMIVGRPTGGKGFVTRCLSGEVRGVRDFIILLIISNSRKLWSPARGRGCIKAEAKTARSTRRRGKQHALHVVVRTFRSDGAPLEIHTSSQLASCLCSHEAIAPEHLLLLTVTGHHSEALHPPWPISVSHRRPACRSGCSIDLRNRGYRA